MARLIQIGFEENSLTSKMELHNINGSPTIQSGVSRTGTDALKISSLVSGTKQSVATSFNNTVGNGPYFARFYFRVDTLPSAENRIAAITSDLGGHRAYITIDNTGKLTLYDEDGNNLGNTTISTTTWYRIEFRFKRTDNSATCEISARVDGTDFGSTTTGTIGTGIGKLEVGGNMNTEAQTTGVWYFDDLAVNDDTGTQQNSYPGDGKVIYLRPNAAGDANSFATQVGGTTSSPTMLTHGNSSISGSGFTTMSISPLSNKLIIVSFTVANSASTNPTISSITGNGLTWHLINSVNWDNSSASRRTTFTYYAVGASPTPGSISVITGETNTLFSWVVTQSGADITNPIVQSLTNQNNDNGTSSITITLSGFASPNNLAYGVFAEWNALTLTPESGWTVLGHDDAGSGCSTWVVYKSTEDTSVVGNFGSADNIGGIAIEIRADPANNYTRVNEVTPDDATSYNASNTLNQEDLFNFDASGIGASDTVNVVAVNPRFANDTADATTAFKVELLKASGGTKSQSAALVPDSTTWRTNTEANNSSTKNTDIAPLVTYADPDGSAWTQSTLDTLQAGYIISTGGTNKIQISNIWVSVDYTPNTITTPVPRMGFVNHNNPGIV